MQFRFIMILHAQGYNSLLLKAIRPYIMKFGVQTYLNTNLSKLVNPIS